MKTIPRIVLGLALIAILSNMEAQNTNGGAGQKLVTSRELPDQYWTDLVTEQPEGYVVDGNGNVHLHSAEALAWLISAVNGLNGQEADDFEGKIVSLENDADLSPAIWTAIASSNDNAPNTPSPLKQEDSLLFFKGVFNGNKHIVSGMATNEGFFGNLKEAEIKDVILKEAFVKDSQQGAFFHQSEFCKINRCWLEGNLFVNDTTGIACFGYVGTASQIANCMFYSPLIDNPSGTNALQSLCAFIENSNGNNTIRNCAIVIDSLAYRMDASVVGINSQGSISNCFSYLGAYKYFELWPYLPNPRSGVVGINYGSVTNCYYNWLDPSQYHNEINTPAVFEGTMSDVVVYDYEGNDWQLMESVIIGGSETSRLEEALNAWVEQQGSAVDYCKWQVDESIFSNGLPVLSCFADVLDLKKNTVLNESITVYPNPASDMISIEGMEGPSIRMYNVFGQLVGTSKGDRISVSGLPQGLYLLRVTDEKGRVVCQKVVVN